MKVSDKVLVVTGGGAGIGREVVLELARRGAKVAAIDVNKAGLAETVTLAGDLGLQISTHVVNIADREAVAKLPAAIKRKHGQIDALVNVAGIIHKFKKVNDLDFSEIERVIDVNLWGPINVSTTNCLGACWYRKVFTICW